MLDPLLPVFDLLRGRLLLVLFDDNSRGVKNTHPGRLDPGPSVATESAESHGLRLAVTVFPPDLPPLFLPPGPLLSLPNFVPSTLLYPLHGRPELLHLPLLGIILQLLLLLPTLFGLSEEALALLQHIILSLLVLLHHLTAHDLCALALARRGRRGVCLHHPPPLLHEGLSLDGPRLLLGRHIWVRLGRNIEAKVNIKVNWLPCIALALDLILSFLKTIVRVIILDIFGRWGGLRLRWELSKRSEHGFCFYRGSRRLRGVQTIAVQDLLGLEENDIWRETNASWGIFGVNVNRYESKIVTRT